MHDQHESTPEEDEQAPEQQQEYEAMEGPGQGDQPLPGDAPPEEPIHES